jgi:DNA-binding MarR family transcriptional regulator
MVSTQFEKGLTLSHLWKLHEIVYILNITLNTTENKMPIANRGDKWLRTFVPYLMYRITSKLNMRIRKKLRTSGVNLARWRVLSVLRAYGEINLGRVVELTVMEQPSVSRIVTQLVKEGLVKRKMSKADSRYVLVRLTAAGEKTFKSIYPTAEAHQKLALRGFTKTEVRALTGYLRRIQKNIEMEE